MKFLEASGLDSSKAFSLLNPGPLDPGPLNSGPLDPGPLDPGPSESWLRKASIYRSLGVGERHVAELDW